MTRQEINNISQKKQDEILKAIRKIGCPVSVKEISKRVPLEYKDVRRQFENLRIKNKIQRTHKVGNEYMYIDNTKGYGTKMERILEVHDQGIWPDEIEKAKRSATVGTVFMYVDGEGRKRKTKVVDNSRTHVCLFSNGQAYTWADVARCLRNRKESLLGEWDR